MIKKFAIEPTAITRWNDFRYVMEKLGFSEGRVLATYPKGWIRSVIDNLDGLGEIERKKFIEKLRLYKEDRIISSAISFQPEISWQRNACANLSEFHRVILDAGADQSFPTEIGKVNEIDEAFFDVPREICCLNTVDGLTFPAELLLNQAAEVALVDPYFKPDIKGCLLVLAKFAELARSGKRFERFYIYIHSDSVPKDRGCSGAAQIERLCQGETLKGLTFVFRVIDPSLSENAFHARYLLTKHGGLRYDKGFRAAVDPEMVDISILDRRIHSLLVKSYLSAQVMPSVVDTWSWHFR
ncbi:hypothetical protein [uncultured Thiocystis sp.]|jgi:hypothetical protein|uniref:hypothetical protein n=1 Tax=uncultured Thiocystis sp. TaxID=1202134 RepID=UPI0025D280E6|nr:hypothetical protein [uncultured Thiocystis sp.]